MPVSDRLIGLETEYAIRLSSTAAAEVPRYSLYQALISAVRTRVVAVPARHFKDGVFLANGGAIWFETERPATGQGLIEGSTPECRGPRAALCYQRAQDLLLGQAARAPDGGHRFTLIKNDRDGFDNVYGAQENYQASLGPPAAVWAWRCGLVVLVPLAVLTWLALLAIVGLILIYIAGAAAFYWIAQFGIAKPRNLAIHLFGRDLVEGRATGQPVPNWMEGVLFWLTRIVQTPLALSVWALAVVTAFRKTRAGLLPFLVSRALVAGAGTVDRDGSFYLADKGPSINSVVGLGNVIGERPIFTMGHFFKAICAGTWFAPSHFGNLFHRQQRLQIGLGDSNMAETAEFLRVGTTALVLELIEANQLPDVPRLKQPIQALQTLLRDPTLKARVALADGRQWTGLQLQRFYCDACRSYVKRHPDGESLGDEIVRRWCQVLDALESLPETLEEAPRDLIGRVDWVTKKYLVDSTPTTDWRARKKIDIRYHELSGQGYFMQLKAAGLVPTLVAPEDIARAIRVAPAGTPATMRGHYIREFTGGATHVTADWSHVWIGRGRQRRTISLRQFHSSKRRVRRVDKTASTD